MIGTPKAYQLHILTFLSRKFCISICHYCSSIHKLLYFKFNHCSTLCLSINYCILVHQLLYYPFLCSEGISASDSQSLMGVWAYIAPVSHNYYFIFISKKCLFISCLLLISYAQERDTKTYLLNKKYFHKSKTKKGIILPTNKLSSGKKK